ncbi:MAG: TrmB family transcriptional regulator [Candidatus Hadarchaeum sp.]|uniref:TrmB family transcriptional regulator n=1 Tax=Candidatus Hadarchaeum sp. TaxID=2883567 RepID=UPI003D0A2556
MEKAHQLLRELGLTEYEARVYCALVSNGPSTAGELSKLANVPYSRIYDILSRLGERGWVEAQAGRPSRYRSRDPAEVVKIVKAEEERRLKEISEALLKELEPLYSKRAEVKRPDVWVIRGGKNILTKTGEMLARAEIEVLLSLPNIPLEISGLTPYLDLLEAKNIPVRILVPRRLKLRGLQLPRKLEIRKRENLFGGGVVIDGREVLLILGNGDELLGIWSDEIGLARFAKEYFEYLWRDSRVA